MYHRLTYIYAHIVRQRRMAIAVPDSRGKELKMTPLISGTQSTKSLAQTLFEGSPTSGWTGPWSALGREQIVWWTDYAAVARQFILDEVRRLTVDEEPVTAHDAQAEASTSLLFSVR